MKAPDVLMRKLQHQMTYYYGENPSPEHAQFSQMDACDFPRYDILREFRQSHPAVIAQRVGCARRLRPRRNRRLNWRFYREILTHGFKG